MRTLVDITHLGVYYVGAVGWTSFTLWVELYLYGP